MLDGEVLAFRDERPLPFSALQQRIGRQKQVAQLARTVPVVFMTYDMLEDDGEDIRGLPQARTAERAWRSAADEVAGPQPDLRPLSDSRPSSTPASWDELAALRADSRARGVEGLMLKRLTSPTASAASAATGGSGRSIRSRSTPC